MRIRPNLHTLISFKTINTELEAKFKNSQYIRVSSENLNMTFDIPIIKDKISYGSGVLPFSSDWVIMGTIYNGQIIRELASEERIEQELSNISLDSEYLGDNQEITKPMKTLCHNNKMAFSSASNYNKNLFILLTYGDNERFVSQYYGKYINNIEMDCIYDNVNLRYISF